MSDPKKRTLAPDALAVLRGLAAAERRHEDPPPMIPPPGVKGELDLQAATKHILVRKSTIYYPESGRSTR